MKIKFTKEQISVFDSAGTVVITSEENTYRYLPFWFKQNDEEWTYEMFSLGENLPNDLVSAIKTMVDSRIEDEI